MKWINSVLFKVASSHLNYYFWVQINQFKYEKNTLFFSTF